MKLIFAGQYFTEGKPPPFKNSLFNCTRNTRCQRKFFVPIQQLSDLQFYVDLKGAPTLISATLLDLCEEECIEEPGDFSDDFNDDFDIGGEVCSPKECDITFQKYVVGQNPQGGWYGVFANPISDCVPKCFFIRFEFEMNGKQYVYYSEQFCIEIGCETLCLIEGCYPNETIGSDAYDCNGIYYGFPAGEETLGTKNFRYFHRAYVRKCSVTDRSVKLSFSYFKSKWNYKTQQYKESLLEFELVPSFYKTHLLGIFGRGNIRINGTEYKLSEEQTWQVIDTDSKLWNLDTLLFDDCKLSFGCAPADCLLPPDDCENNLEMGDWGFDEEGENFLIYLIGDFQGALGVNWEFYEVNPIGGAQTLLDSGSLAFPPAYITIPTDGSIQPGEKCYLIKWQTDCGFNNGPWKETQFGKCDQEAGIAGTVSMYSYGAGQDPAGSEQCRAQGWTKLRFRFSAPIPANIDISIAYVYSLASGSPAYTQGEGRNILDPSHPDYAAAWSNLGQGTPFDLTIPAGSTDWLSPLISYPSPYFPVTVTMLSYPDCNPTFGNKFFAKLYFRVTSPSGQILNLVPVFDTPAPYNTQVNAFTMVQVP